MYAYYLGANTIHHELQNKLDKSNHRKSPGAGTGARKQCPYYCYYEEEIARSKPRGSREQFPYLFTEIISRKLPGAGPGLPGVIALLCLIKNV